MTVKIACITFDCADALTVARFWSAALDRPFDPNASSDFASIGFAGHRDTVGWTQVERDDDPTSMFARVPGPKTAKKPRASRPHGTGRRAEIVSATREN
jgi:hypothetical protein